MSEQYPLDLPHTPAFAAEDYLASDCNAAVRGLIERWPSWPHGTAAIWGPKGSGKSHLSAIWGTAAEARPLDPAALPALDLASLPAPCRFVLDLGARALQAEAETPLFHLLNIVRERQGALLLVARAAPARWKVGLPDLSSRLRALAAAEALPPDDALFARVVEKLCFDRQLAIDRPTIDYLAKRLDRSFAAAVAIVAALDRAALAAKRPITLSLARAALKTIRNTGE